MDRILETIPKLKPWLKAGTLVTDAGSTKQAIVNCAEAHLPAGAFLGGHPIAGKEQRGPEAAEGELFRGRMYVLTPSGEATQEASFRKLLAAMGANVLEMTAEEHDHTLAYTSHLPQLLSTALAATLARDGKAQLSQVYGTGLLDMTRLALSSPELWTSILQTNKNQVAQAIDALVQVLIGLKAELGEREIAYTFEQATAFAASIRKTNDTSRS